MIQSPFHLASLLICLSGVSLATAQTTPQIGYLYPAGAQQGTQVEVTVGGKYMPGPCGVWIAGQGVTSQSSSTEGRLALTIDPKAELGSRAIRIYSVQGGSKPRKFLIGDLPEALEDPLAELQPIEMPVTFNGQLNPKGDVDQLRFSLNAGQRIVCSAVAEAIGSPSDLVLRLQDTDGRIVATANDQQGRDPRLVYRCESPGEYTLQVYDFNLAGGPSHVYRLTVTDGPYLDTTFPPGVSQGVSTKVTVHGWNLPGGNSVQLDVNATGTQHVITLPGAANQLTLPVGKTAETEELEPNDAISQAKPIKAPLVMNGRFLSPGDQDVFSIAGTKGDTIMLQVESAKLGYPTDVVMRLLNADGTLIREIDDVRPSKDPSYKFAIPKDGTYFVQLSERAARGGPRFIYRLLVGVERPRLRLSVKASEFTVVPGATLTLPVSVGRIDGFAEEIEITAEGLPSGVTCPAVRHTVKSKAASLELTAPVDTGFLSGAFRVVARIVRDGKPSKTTTAHAVEDLWLAVGPKVPFELSVGSTILEAYRLAAFPFPVSVRRDEGYSVPIRLVGVDRDRRGTVIPLSGMVEAEALSGKIPLVIQTAAGEGTTHRCRVMGIATVKDRSGKQHPVFHVAKGTMFMGCQPNLLTLTAEPQRITRSPGKSFEVTLTAMRRVPMESVTISLKLPPGIEGITANPVTLPQERRQATISVEVAADSHLPPELEIEFHAESSRAGLPVYAIAPMKLVAP